MIGAWAQGAAAAALGLGAAGCLARRPRARAPTLAAALAASGWVACGLGLAAREVLGEGWASAAVAASAATSGLWLSARLGRLAAWELALSSLAPSALLLSAAWAGGGGEGMAGAPARSLLVLPAQIALWGVFGLSLGALWWDGRRLGRPDLGLAWEARVGWRFLLARGSPVLSVVTRIAMVGVTLGVWLVLVSLAILSGFEEDLEAKIIGSGAHLRVQEARARPFVPPDGLADLLAGVPHVVAWAPFIAGEVALKSASNYAAATLSGITPSSAGRVLSALQGGGVAALVPPAAPAGPAGPAAPSDRLPGDDGRPEGSPLPAPPALAPLVLGVEIAKTLGVQVGDRVHVISPHASSLTPAGPKPRSAGFRVAAILSTGMYEFDARHAYIEQARAADFFELEPGAISGLFVACRRADDAPRVARALSALLPAELVAQDWQSRNRSLFSALKLERLVAFVVLIFIILVASFAIVNTLSMSVIEKRREIAILVTMGAPRLSVAKVFMVQGLWVGGLGTLFGVGLGTLSIQVLRHLRFFLPQDVYYLESLPVAQSRMDVLQVAAAALLIAWDFAVFPALRASALTPVEGLRDG